MTALIDLLNEEKRILHYIDVYESSIKYQESFIEMMENKDPQTEHTQYSIKAAQLEITKDTEKLEGYKRDLAKCRSKILEYFRWLFANTIVKENKNETGI